jgi:hypothetical protein
MASGQLLHGAIIEAMWDERLVHATQ